MAPKEGEGAAAWRVVGGEDKGGILVRRGQDRTSDPEPLRLATGACVQELELLGERLQYRLIAGTGPPAGWVSIRTLGKDLLVRATPSDKLASGEAEHRWDPHDGKVYSFRELVLARKEMESIVRQHWQGACIPVPSPARSGSTRPEEKAAAAPAKAAAPEASIPPQSRPVVPAQFSEAQRAAVAKRAEAAAKREAAARVAAQQEVEAAASVQRTREATKGTCSPEVESRFSSLERLVERQQRQLEQLGTFSARLLQELSDLHRGHAQLHASHTFLCDCLAGSRLLQSDVSNVVLNKQARQRGRLGVRLCKFSGLLENRAATGALWRLLGDQGAGLCRVSQTSRSFLGLRDSVWRLGSEEAVSAKSSSSRANGRASDEGGLHRLDEGVWAAVKKYEPTQSTLDQWERSQTVQAVLGGLSGVEGVIGKTETLKFSDVHSVFAQIGMPLDHFVNKFRFMPSTSLCDIKALEEVTNSVLRRFAQQPVEGSAEDRMSCRDLFRMLELVGFPLQRFKLVFPGAATVQDSPGDGSLLKIGGYTIRRQIGQGFKGARCYLGELPSDGSRAAVKWPAPSDEVITVKEIARKAKDCLGIPRLLGSGTFQGKTYLVTELLGSPLTNVFQRLHDKPLQQRWKAVKTIGRMMVRRLQAFHASGFVHCDISPENILLGRSQGKSGQATLFLIDFELAQKFPGGSKQEGNIGSAEWSSIRSADFVERTPEDDLESLGWVLLHGLTGTLPWFDWLGAAYRDWDSRWTRAQTVKQVQRAKEGVLKEGPAANGWRRSVGMPEELLHYLRMCRQHSMLPGSADYDELAIILGGDRRLPSQESEKRDAEQFVKQVVPLL